MTTTADDFPQPVIVKAPVTNLEPAISNILRIGVATSLLLVVVGTVVTFAHHPHYVSSGRDLARLTRPGADFPHDLASVIRGLQRGEGQAVVVTGLLLLIATPVLRVAISVLTFIIQHDRTYVLITSTVLSLLLASFILVSCGP